MPRLAANLSLLFPQLPFPERFAAAAKAGFRYVEYQLPYAFGSAQEIAGHARAAGVEVVLHNLPAGDAAKGDRGISCQPGRVDEFREGVERAIEYAKAVGCPRLNTLTGSKDGIDVIDAVGADNLLLQYDVFHMQIVEGDLAKTIERLLPRIGHIQIADVPGRNEPGTGEINFNWLLAHIDALGYQGWIGAEYISKGDTVEGLKWATPYLK